MSIIGRFERIAELLFGSIECPLMAESGPSKSANFHDLNVRFGEKRTLHCCFRNAQNNAKYLSVRMTALHPKADIQLILS